MEEEEEEGGGRPAPSPSQGPAPGFDDDVAREMKKLEMDLQRMLEADRNMAADNGPVADAHIGKAPPQELKMMHAAPGIKGGVANYSPPDKYLPSDQEVEAYMRRMAAGGNSGSVSTNNNNDNNNNYPAQRHNGDPSSNYGGADLMMAGSPPRRKGGGLAHMYETDEDQRRKQNLQSNYNQQLQQQVNTGWCEMV